MKFWIIFARVLAGATIVTTGVLLWPIEPLLTGCLVGFVVAVAIEGVAQEGVR